ncbi:MAG: O-succinylbenzoic acid--CoA ligase [Sphingobacteriales bacterium]|jgi:O-succinylbenzoic acid--CoA ligase
MEHHSWTISDAFIDIPAETWHGKEPELLTDLKSQLSKSPWLQGLVDTLEEWINSSSMRCQTSGSTGTPKLFSFSKKQIQRSAERTLSHLNIPPNSWLYCPIPLAFIGGKMMLFRALLGGHHLRVVQPHLKPSHFEQPKFAFASFTPSMWNEVVATFPHKNCAILLGGGPVSASLEKTSTPFNQVYNSYGMTETLSHVALRKLNHDTHFIPLEGVLLSTELGGNLSIEDGDIQVSTNDLVSFTDLGHFMVLGRQDFIINSGGIKINPELWEKELGFPCCISWLTSAQFGQELVLVVDPEKAPSWKEKLDKTTQKRLIKKVLISAQFPKTSSGKIDRNKLQHMLVEYQDSIIHLEK